MPTPSFTTVICSFKPFPSQQAQLAGWEGKQANISGWWKTVTKHACPLLLTTFLISPLLSHLQENVNMCYREKMYLLIYVLDKFMLFSRIIKTWLLTTLPFESKDIFINDFKTWRNRNACSVYISLDYMEDILLLVAKHGKYHSGHDLLLEKFY